MGSMYLPGDHQEQYWDRDHDRHHGSHMHNVRQNDRSSHNYNDRQNNRHSDKHNDRQINMHNHRYNDRRNDRYNGRPADDQGEEEEEENQDGDFVTGYVLKTPKTPLDWIRRWAIQTSCNGIPNIQRTKSPVRLALWTMIVLTGTVMTVVSVTGTVVTYLNYPYNVVVTNDLVTTITFPAVTVCNINPVRKSKIHLGGTHLEEALIEEYGEYSSFDVTFNRSVRGELREDFDNLYSQMDASLKHAMGHQIEDMLLTCKYGRDPCNVKNFTLLQNPYYGNCYMINNALDGEKLLQTHKPGSHTGMNLEFYIQPDEYVPAVTTSVGMRIAIHGNEDMPFPEDTGLLITPGFTTLIALRAKKIERLAHPFKSNCWDIERDEAQAVSVYSQFYRVDYTQQACQKTCYQRRVLDTCGCGDPRVPLYGIALGNNNPENKSAIPCLTKDQEACEEHIKDVANSEGLVCNCSGACTILAYNPIISFARWPNEEIRGDYAAALKKLYPNLNKSEDYDPRESIARVQIFFDEMIVENVTEQEAYPLINLYSDLGGNIGFYLGLSIIGMFEFFELLIDMLGSGVTCVKTSLGGNSKKQRPKQSSRNNAVNTDAM